MSKNKNKTKKRNSKKKLIGFSNFDHHHILAMVSIIFIISLFSTVMMNIPGGITGFTIYESQDINLEPTDEFGAWNTIEYESYEGSSALFTNTLGSRLEYNFNGSSVQIITQKRNDFGIMNLEIDGTEYELDLYSSETEYNVNYNYELSDGEHNIIITLNENKNNLSEDSYILIDEVVITDTIEISEVVEEVVEIVEDVIGEEEGVEENITEEVVEEITEVVEDVLGEEEVVEENVTEEVVNEIVVEEVTEDVLVEEEEVEENVTEDVVEEVTEEVVEEVSDVVEDLVILTQAEDIDFPGLWFRGENEIYSNGISLISNYEEDSLTYDFNGRNIYILTEKREDFGVTNITVDDESYLVDLYSEFGVQPYLISISDLENIDHTITIKLTDLNNANSYDNYISVDAFLQSIIGDVSSYELYDINNVDVDEIDNVLYEVVSDDNEVSKNVSDVNGNDTEVLEDERNITENNVTGNLNITETNVTIDNVTISNVASTDVNYTETTIAPEVIRINEPVKWTKTIQVEGSTDNLTIDLPKEVVNISIKKIDEYENEEFIEDKVKVVHENKETKDKETKSISDFVKDKEIEELEREAGIKKIFDGEVDDLEKKIVELKQDKDKRDKEKKDMEEEEDLSGLFEITGNSITGFAVIGEEIVEEVIEEPEVIVEVVEDIVVEEVAELIIEENITSDDELEIEYYTEAPISVENNISDMKKEIVISSETHYENILAYTYVNDIPLDAIKIYRTTNGSRELTELYAYADLNNNSLIDYVEWIVPHLSNQSYEVSIEILNVQSYPMVGENWTIRFTTSGVSNLTIRASNGTQWDNLGEAGNDLQFLTLLCDNDSVNYTWTDNNEVFVQDYNCSNTGYETSLELTPGEHHLEFIFGDQVAYAHNDANIDSCQALTIGSSVYRLTQDVTSGPTCFAFEVDDITLDCQGYTLTGNYTGTGETEYYGINITGISNSNITNCTFMNFTNAIYLNDANDTTFDNLNLTNNSGSGIYVYNSHNSTVQLSDIRNNANYGIYFTADSHNNTIFNNTFFNEYPFGVPPAIVDIYFDSGGNFDNNLFYANEFTNSSSFSFSGTTGNLMLNNSVLGNWWTQIDEPAEACYDSNNNGICDDTYSVSAETDYLPLRKASITAGISLTLVTSSGAGQNKDATADGYIGGGSSDEYYVNVINSLSSSDNITLNLSNYNIIDVLSLNQSSFVDIPAYSKVVVALNVSSANKGTYIAGINATTNDSSYDAWLNITTSIIDTFTASTTYEANLKGVTTPVTATADIDKDGNLDLIVVGTVSFPTVGSNVYTNDGTTFNDNATWSINITNVSTPSIAVGDFNNDNYTDLIIAGNDADNAAVTNVYINNGSSFVQNSSWEQNISKMQSVSFVLGDIDSDGKIDIIMTGANNTDPTNKNPVVYINNGTSFIRDYVWDLNLSSIYGGDVLLADIDNNNYLDLFIIGNNDDLSLDAQVYMNNGTNLVHNITYTEGIRSAYSQFTSSAFADVNNDGWIDLVIQAQDGGTQYLDIYLNNQTSFELNTSWATSTTNIQAGELLLGDFNNNGNIDIGWIKGSGGGGGGGGSTMLMYNNTGSGFIEDTDYQKFISSTLSDGSGLFMDADSDNNLDFVVIGDDSGATGKVYLNKISTANSAPSAPTTFGSDYDTGELNLSWSAGTDTEGGTLYYNLRIGTSSGTDDVMSGSYGYGSTPIQGMLGNVQHRTEVNFNISNQTYYWAVQTIDSSLIASTWSVEQVYNTTTPGDPAPPAAQSGIEISTCKTLDQTGQIYLLNTSILDTASDKCMNITAINVTLDCQGLVIKGTNLNTQYGIYANASNATITNCSITHFQRGIYVDNSGDDWLIKENNISHNHQNGIDFEDAASDDHNITFNVFINNTHPSGSDYDIIWDGGGSNNTVRYNNFSSRNSANILIQGNSVYNNILDNNFYIAETNHIFLDDVSAISTYTIIKGNYFNGSENWAIYLQDADYTLIEDNNFTNNGNAANEGAIYTSANAAFNNITNNSFDLSSNYAIYFSGTNDDNNKVWKNRFLRRGIYDASGGENDYCPADYRYGNYYNINNSYYTITNFATAAIYVRPDTDCGPTPTADTIIVNTSATDSWSFGGSSAVYDTINKGLGNVQVGDKINVTPDSTESEYVAANNYIALAIYTPNITLDCGGTNISGKNSDGTGIYSLKDNFTIKDCVIKHYDDGIYIDSGADGSQIIGNTILHNPVRGIYLPDANSDRHNISYNVFINNTHPSGTDYDIFWDSSGSNNMISYNNFTSRNNANIEIEGTSSFNTIDSNRFNGAQTNHIFLDDVSAWSTYSTISNNYFNGSENWAIYLDDADYTLVENNNFTYNGNAGTEGAIYTGGGATFNNITNNSFDLSSNYAIYFSGSTDDNNKVWRNRFLSRGIYDNSGGENDYCPDDYAYGNYYDINNSYYTINNFATAAIYIRPDTDCGPAPNADTIIVNTSATDSWSFGGTDVTYNTINEGLGNVQVGDKINVTPDSSESVYVAANTYVALAVYTPNITLDCGGMNISGKNSDGTGIYSVKENFTIKNCIIKHYDDGIYIDSGADGTHIIGNIITHNIVRGVYLPDANSDRHNISHNQFVNNTHSAGGSDRDIFWDNSGSNNTISYNNFTSHNYANIEIEGTSNDNNILYNRFYTAETYHIFLDDTSTDAVRYTIRGNYFNGSRNWAIDIEAAEYTLIENNNFTNNGDATSEGSIYITGTSTWGNITNNSFWKNPNYATWSIYFVGSGDDYNTVWNNVFLNNESTSWYIEDNGGTNWYNLSNLGNYWQEYDSAAEGCNDGGKDGICDITYTADDQARAIDYYPSTTSFGWDVAPNITAINPARNEVLAVGTKVTWVNITTDVASTCQYNDSSDFTYGTNGTNFPTSNNTYHALNFTDLVGQTYTIYQRCSDTTNSITNYDAYIHSFSVGVSMNVSTVVNPSTANASGTVYASGYLNFTNGTTIQNNPVDIYVDGTKQTTELGTGNDGELTVATVDRVINNYTKLIFNASTGDTVLQTEGVVSFSGGDEILIIQTQNGTIGTAGDYEFATISSISGNNFTVSSALSNNYYTGIFNSTTGTNTQIVRVPHYSNVRVLSNGSITAKAWNGSTGGIIIFKTQGNLTLLGSINASATGFRGGKAGECATTTSTQGESYQGMGANANKNPNQGGGGASTNSGDTADGAGGGSFNTTGNDGATSSDSGFGVAGYTYGQINLSYLYLGSGGGGAGCDTDSGTPGGAGGNAGGIIFVYANNITLIENGTIINDGEPGGTTIRAGGGGGSGGTTYLSATDLSIRTNNVTVLSGNGGGGSANSEGGSGGSGIIRVDYVTFAGTSSPETNYPGTFNSYTTDANGLYNFSFTASSSAGTYDVIANSSYLSYYAEASTTITVQSGDSTAATISLINPTNQTNLTAGTISTWVNITTNENATCQYNDTNDFTFETNGTTLSTTNNTWFYLNYSNNSVGLVNESTYTFYYKCNDTGGNINSPSAAHTFGLSPTPDVIEPIVTLEAPTNNTNLTAGTTWTWVNISTNEYTTCQYNETDENFSFGTGGTNLSTVNNTYHYFNYSNYSVGLVNGTTYIIYYRCQDNSINNNSGIYSHSFGVNQTPDIFAPEITLINPTNQTNLSAGTLSTWVNISTNEYATCQYNETDKNFAFGVNGMTLSTSNNTWFYLNYSNNSVGLVNESTYTFYYKCNDTFGNTISSSIGHTFGLSAPADIDAPVISIINPINETNLDAGTQSVWLNISTNENANCKYHANQSTFTFVDGTDLTQLNSTIYYANYTGLTNGSSHVIYYKCNDSIGNQNTNSFVHSFNVKMPAAITTEYNDTTGTNLTAVNNLSAVENLTLATSDGNIKWTLNTVNATGKDFDTFVEIGYKFIVVNTSQLDSTVNDTADISIENVICNGFKPRTDLIYTDREEFTSLADIQTNGRSCPASICSDFVCENGVLNFTVAHFTGYAFGGNANLTVYDEFEESQASIDTSITFYANYTDINGNALSTASCNFTADDNVTSFEMSYNGDNYNYTKILGFSSTGTYNWNATCYQEGYTTLTANDTVVVSGSTELTACQDLSTTATTYTLTQAVQNDSNCFNVISDNITLDCQGFNIVGNGTDVEDNQYYGINITNRFNTTIINCSILNFSAGIYTYNSNLSTITNSTLTDNKIDGVYLYMSHNATIKTSYFSNKDSNYSIQMRISSYNKYINNTFDVENLNYSSKLGDINGISDPNGNIKFNTYYGNILKNATSINGIQSVDANIYNNSFGNQWADYDEPIEGCYDTDLDRICDNSYNLTANIPDIASGGNMIDYVPMRKPVITPEINITIDVSKGAALLGDSSADGYIIYGEVDNYSLNVFNSQNITDNITMYLTNYNSFDTLELNQTSFVEVPAYSKVGLVLNMSDTSVGTFVTAVNATTNTSGYSMQLNITTKITQSFKESPNWDSDLESGQFPGLVAGDINNDNLTDLIITSGAAANQEYLLAQIHINDGTSLNKNITWSSNITNVSYPSIMLADINNDLWLDLMIAGSTNPFGGGNETVFVYINNHTSFVQNNTWSQNITPKDLASITTNDIDLDGDIDIVLIGGNTNDHASKIYINNGSSFVEDHDWQKNLTGRGDGGAFLFDINNDNYLDLLLSGEDINSDYVTEIYINNASTFVYNNTWSKGLEEIPVSTFNNIAFGDLNNDNWIDAVVLGGWVYINNQTTLVKYSNWSDNLTGDISFLADYNNDGYIDLLTTRDDDNNNELKVFKNNGSALSIDTDASRNLGNNMEHGMFINLDSDDNVDIVATQSISVSPPVVNDGFVYLNKIDNNNTAPTPPTQFSASYSGGINVAWANATDAEGGQVYYNLRIGTTTGGYDIISPKYGYSSNPTQGIYGNMHQINSTIFNIPQEERTFYLGVQPLDTGLKTGNWTETTITYVPGVGVVAVGGSATATGIAAALSGTLSEDLLKTILKYITAEELGLSDSLSSDDVYTLLMKQKQEKEKTNINIIEQALEQAVTEEAKKELQTIQQNIRSTSYSAMSVYKSFHAYNITANKTGKSVNVTLFTINFTADKRELHNVTIIEIFPKFVAETSNKVHFIHEKPKVLQDDPIVKFYFNKVKKGETKEIHYLVKKHIDTLATQSIAVHEGLSTEKEEELEKEEEKEIETPVPQFNKNSLYMVLEMMIVLLIIFYVIGEYDFQTGKKYKKKVKEVRKKEHKRGLKELRIEKRKVSKKIKKIYTFKKYQKYKKQIIKIMIKLFLVLLVVLLVGLIYYYIDYSTLSGFVSGLKDKIIDALRQSEEALASSYYGYHIVIGLVSVVILIVLINIIKAGFRLLKRELIKIQRRRQNKKQKKQEQKIKEVKLQKKRMFRKLMILKNEMKNKRQKRMKKRREERLAQKKEKERIRKQQRRTRIITKRRRQDQRIKNRIKRKKEKVRKREEKRRQRKILKDRKSKEKQENRKNKGNVKAMEKLRKKRKLEKKVRERREKEKIKQENRKRKLERKAKKRREKKKIKQENRKRKLERKTKKRREKEEKLRNGKKKNKIKQKTIRQRVWKIVKIKKKEKNKSSRKNNAKKKKKKKKRKVIKISKRNKNIFKRILIIIIIILLIAWVIDLIICYVNFVWLTVFMKALFNLIIETMSSTDYVGQVMLGIIALLSIILLWNVIELIIKLFKKKR